MHAELPLVHTVTQHPQVAAAVGVGALALLGVVGWLIFRKKPTAEEIERRRREQLATMGRIIDGTMIEATGEEQNPEVLVYKYELAGVEYECAQDVSRLHDRIATLRWDLPVTIKYDPRNPCNSIVIAESWSGLRGNEHKQAEVA